jgi:ABC-2 type transport system permease protein
MNKLWRVARHEFKVTAANKAFVILTILGPFLILAVTVLPGLLSNNLAGQVIPETKVSLYCPDQALDAALEPVLSGQLKMQVTRVGNAEALKASVLGGSAKYGIKAPAGLYDKAGFELYALSTNEYQVYGMLQGSLAAAVVNARIADKHLDSGEIKALIEQPALTPVKIAKDSAKEEKSSDEKFVATLFTMLGFMMLLYMTTLLYGQMIGRSVVTEKTSKTVEIMLSSVSPKDLMFGKLIGMGIAGLLQYAIWIGMSLAFNYLISPSIGLSLPVGLTPSNLLFLVLFFVLGYFLYSAIYAGLGAAAEDEQHLTQLAWPVLIFLMIPLVMISPIIMNPDTGVVVFMSWFPLTSPLVMLMRVLVAAPAWYEVAGSVALLVATIFGTVVASAKIFRVGILMTGKRFKLSEVLRWVRT